MADSNRHGIWTFERTAGSLTSKAAAVPLTGIRGPATGMMFVASVALDPARREIYTVDNDIGDRLETFSYDSSGNVKPIRVLDVPHQAWGIGISEKRNEIAVSVESSRMVVIYRRGSTDADLPIRVLRGPKTGMGDPHGVGFDDVNNEFVVANHGNQTAGVFRRDIKTDPSDTAGTGKRVQDPLDSGRWEPPSVTIYAADAGGDAAPLRTISGAEHRPELADGDFDRRGQQRNLRRQQRRQLGPRLQTQRLRQCSPHSRHQGSTDGYFRTDGRGG